jgi:cell division protein FtsN
MTRDYRKRVEPQQKPQKPPVPGWVPFFYGFLLGAVLVAVGWIVLTPPGTELVIPDYLAGSSSSNQLAGKAKTKAEPEPERPRFDFYRILPEMEVIISDDETVIPVMDDEPETPAEISDKVRYRLQVGSFKKMSDADRQKARLALLGVEAEIQKVNIRQGGVYYRVMTPPISSKNELNAKRTMLQKNRINSLVVQVKS